MPEQLKLGFILSFSLTCCVWPFLICSYTYPDPFGCHSPTCLAGFPGRVLHKKSTIPSVQRHFQASLVFPKPSKINHTWISQIPSKFPDLKVNTKCTNLPVGSHGSTSNPYQKSKYPVAGSQWSLLRVMLIFRDILISLINHSKLLINP